MLSSIVANRDAAGAGSRRGEACADAAERKGAVEVDVNDVALAAHLMRRR